jgi:hypothetical protein
MTLQAEVSIAKYQGALKQLEELAKSASSDRFIEEDVMNQLCEDLESQIAGVDEEIASAREEVGKLSTEASVRAVKEPYKPSTNTAMASDVLRQ